MPSKRPPNRSKPSVASQANRNAVPPDDDPEASLANPAVISLALQQLTLNVFRKAFPDTFNPELANTLQSVKRALFERDFMTAFGDAAHLQAYAARWSPSRALAYTLVFCEALNTIGLYSKVPAPAPSNEPEAMRIVCLGGGAGAELVALGAAVKSLRDEGQDARRSIEMTAVDIAAWGPIMETLFQGLVTPPPISKYAAAHVVAANVPLIGPTDLRYSFIQRNLLDTSPEEVANLVSGADLVTIFFTLNELYSTSMAKTNTLLMRIKKNMAPGSHILVVDSAGSYATITLNGGEKNYPMHWLLDHIMLKEKDGDKKAEGEASKSKSGEPSWTKLQSEESTWFRIPEGLKYPPELENMRYQLHLYQNSKDVPQP
ncbi:hypothetical protein BT63DRAFT_118107 [Microthyrium microscopicum]|uniref:25S rRNA (Uridine(2843)-N(3))-methyltransferase n=1 Tax=Microthyrium microscopicum TaxID=703497 RepID=A0A6A6TUB4_9PEZI|nr:hypothetical protein BT63DRAFT_118107 [Microthyrium microscopicum]